MALTKNINMALLAWQDINSGNVTLGTEVNCSSFYAASFGIRIGRRSATAFTAGWPNIRIEASPEATGGSWIPIYVYQPSVGASIANTTLNGAVSANAANFVVASASNIAAGDILFLGDSSFNTNTTTYELVRVKTVASTTITTEDPVVNAHPSGAIVTDQAEMYFPALSLLTYSRLRAVLDDDGSGQPMAAQVSLESVTSL
jgi:hypothetical protein